MDYSKLEKSLSKPRLNRYLTTCKYSKKSAIKLYILNLKLSQSFYPLLNLFETIIRNSIHEELKSHFQDHDWIQTQKRQFMSNRSISFTKFYLKKCVESAENKIKKNGRSITTSRIISEQTFGFWTSLFDNHHYKLIGGCVIKVFPNKPKHINRTEIAKELGIIRDFRNRVYHNEPICFNLTKVDLSNVQLIKSKILMLIEWINPDLISVFNKFSEVDYHIEKCEQIRKSIG